MGIAPQLVLMDQDRFKAVMIGARPAGLAAAYDYPSRMFLSWFWKAIPNTSRWNLADGACG